MHVMDDNVLYYVILGHLWLNAHKAMASTYHRCVKTVWRGRLVTIEATRMPYDSAELHYAEVALYQELKPKGGNRILPFNATILEQQEDDDGEVIESKRAPKIRQITKLDGKEVYEF